MTFVDYVLLESQRRKRRRTNPKNTAGLSCASRKRKHQKLRAPIRCSRRVYPAGSSTTEKLKKYMQRPNIQVALTALGTYRAHRRVNESSFDCYNIFLYRCCGNRPTGRYGSCC
ncbi:hypothetical protein JG688_00015102 [Phytophthora aleatoria]|uniref:Uncharacterized protein n=1 Tax=Phytophthora aleatoria TaxID=2496075 RepID=A0A8J5I5X4_9STRA|nr:hypothetical protein JG688_00015102 [Phytophthora aleatoria]